MNRDVLTLLGGHIVNTKRRSAYMCVWEGAVWILRVYSDVLNGTVRERLYVCVFVSTFRGSHRHGAITNTNTSWTSTASSNTERQTVTWEHYIHINRRRSRLCVRMTVSPVFVSTILIVRERCRIQYRSKPDSTNNTVAASWCSVRSYPMTKTNVCENDLWNFVMWTPFKRVLKKMFPLNFALAVVALIQFYHSSTHTILHRELLMAHCWIDSTFFLQGGMNETPDIAA